MPLINKIFDRTQKPDVIDIAIWGPPQSGKTNYLAMLLLSPKLDVDGWSLNAGIKTTRFLGAGYEHLLREKEFIPPTLEDEGSFYSFNFTVYLPEFAGEYYENPDRYTDFAKKIAKSDGIIWLVDPVEIDNPTEGRKSYTGMILEWLGILQEYNRQRNGKIKTHMAFCLTKMDHPNHISEIDNAEKYCLKKLGKPVQRFLKNFCDEEKVDFFATSAAGVLDDKITSNVDQNNPRKLIEEPTPINLFDPFEWLFNVI